MLPMEDHWWSKQRSHHLLSKDFNPNFKWNGVKLTHCLVISSCVQFAPSIQIVTNFENICCFSSHREQTALNLRFSVPFLLSDLSSTRWYKSKFDKVALNLGIKPGNLVLSPLDFPPMQPSFIHRSFSLSVRKVQIMGFILIWVKDILFFHKQLMLLAIPYYW